MRGPIALLTAVGMFIVILAGGPPSWSQERVRPAAAPSSAASGRDEGHATNPLQVEALFGAPATGPREVTGVRSCFLCHSKSEVSADLNLPPDVTGINDDGWVLLNEMVTWTKHDKHYQAYTVLLTERTQQMASRMGVVDPETGKSLLHRDARCLACHSSVPVAQLRIESGDVPAPLTKVETATDSRFNLGVSCEGCHGPSGTGKDGQASWGQVHWEQADWRTRPAAEKFSNFGFWDVRTPSTRARICLSCHLGDVEQGKVLTHEMYAAGHPPLPSFDGAAFVEQQPRHWRDLKEKAMETRDAFLNLREEQRVQVAFPRTRSSLVAGLLACGESARLTADLIDKDVASTIEKPVWPELAQLSCYACHHALERDGWRQTRPRHSVPGRPLLTEWPFALASVAAEWLDQQAEFEQLHGDLLSAMNAQPFGRPADLAVAARNMSAAIQAWATKLDQRELSPDDVTRWLDLIARAGAEQTWDYDSARQLTWAYAAALDELRSHDRALAATRSGGDMMKARMMNQPKVWTGWMSEPAELSPAQFTLKEMADFLILDLRAGRSTTHTLAGERQPRPQTEVELEKVLPRIAEYHPELVQQAFQQLRTRDASK